MSVLTLTLNSTPNRDNPHHLYPTLATVEEQRRDRKEGIPKRYLSNAVKCVVNIVRLNLSTESSQSPEKIGLSFSILRL